jgi:hypothetical protein
VGDSTLGVGVSEFVVTGESMSDVVGVEDGDLGRVGNASSSEHLVRFTRSEESCQSIRAQDRRERGGDRTLMNAQEMVRIEAEPKGAAEMESMHCSPPVWTTA